MAKRKSTKGSVRQSARRKQELRAQQRRVRITWGGIALVAVALLAAFVYFVVLDRNNGTSETRPLADVPAPERNNYYAAYPEMVIDPRNDYEAVIRTSKGEIRLELFPDIAPLAVNNFVFLAREGFYDGLTFHRVMEDFMAQGGDPLGSGSGGPGYAFEDEFDENLVFDRAGLLAMANSGANTNGSQFFITFSPQLHLNGLHTIFGELISGEEALRSLNLVLPGASGGLSPDTIERVDIIENVPE